MIMTSNTNPVIKQARKIVTTAKARRQEGLFAAEGLRLCLDAAENGGVIHTLFVTPAFEQAFGAQAARIRAVAARTYTVSDGVMARLADTESPQGVLCLCQTPTYGRLPQQGGRFAVLENLADPANLGAIARTAEALGINGLLVCGGCEAYHPKALRASMGALLRLPVFQAPVADALSALHALGVTTYAAVVRQGEWAAGQTVFEPACAVVIGNEANGLTPATAAACRKRVTIPMAGRAESLNAAAAACILLWEITNRGQSV